MSIDAIHAMRTDYKQECIPVSKCDRGSGHLIGWGGGVFAQTHPRQTPCSDTPGQTPYQTDTPPTQEDTSLYTTTPSIPHHPCEQSDIRL